MAWCLRSLECGESMKYLYVQLDLIELALTYARNQIDLAHSEMNKLAGARFDSANVRDSSSQRTAEMFQCAWSTASGFRTWARSSESHNRGESSAFTQAQGNFFQNAQNTASRRANSFAYGTDLAQSQESGGNVTDGRTQHVRTAQAQGNMQAWRLGGTLHLQISIPTFGTTSGTIGLIASFSSSAQDASSIEDMASANSSSAFSNNFSASVADTIGHSEGEQHSRAEGLGERHQSSTGESHAGASGNSQGHSETHQGSDRVSHAEQQSGDQSTGQSLDHAESDARDFADQVATSYRRRWSQIFDSLQMMYQDVLAQIKEFELVLRAQRGYTIKTMARLPAHPATCLPRPIGQPAYGRLR